MRALKQLSFLFAVGDLCELFLEGLVFALLSYALFSELNRQLLFHYVSLFDVYFAFVAHFVYLLAGCVVFVAEDGWLWQ